MLHDNCQMCYLILVHSCTVYCIVFTKSDPTANLHFNLLHLSISATVLFRFLYNAMFMA